MEICARILVEQPFLKEECPNGARIMISQSARSLLEENRKLLTRRGAWVKTHGHGLALGMDVDTTAVLHALSPAEIERACDAVNPIFGLAVDEVALANLAKADPMEAIDDQSAELIASENEDVLFNRWAAAREDEVQAKIVFGLSGRMIAWLRSATLADLRVVARSGHVCIRIAARPSYLWHAGKTEHLSQSQRTGLAIVNRRNTAAIHSAPAWDGSTASGLEMAEDWDSPAFVARFEMLVQYTNRPAVIRQMMMLECPDKTLRRKIRDVGERFKLNRSAAKGRRTGFSELMKTVREKYHYSIVYSIYSQSGIEASVADGNYIDHLMEIYQRYLAVTGSRLETAALDFETYAEYLAAITRGNIQVNDCSACGAQHISKLDSPSIPECPFCVAHEHRGFNISSVLAGYQSNESENRRSFRAYC